MREFTIDTLKQLYKPATDSHKGQNGKLLIIGGSHLFHAASLWALAVASRIVDMVFYSSVPDNNEIAQKAKEEFRNGIVVPRDQLEEYIEESDCVLLGPGMVRTEEKLVPTEDYQVKDLSEINQIGHEGIQTYYLTKYVLSKYPGKKWVLDAGALQMMEIEWLKQLKQPAILTPHEKEFEKLFNFKLTNQQINQSTNKIGEMAKKNNCIILLKGQTDVVCPPRSPSASARPSRDGLGEAGSPERCVRISGGNAGMTKGGTGDVLAGLVAALACKNDPFLAACAGSYINKKAGDKLFQRIGPYFNASDLALEIPKVMAML